MSLLIFTNARVNPGGGTRCPECDAEVYTGGYGVNIEAYEEMKTLPTLLDEMKIEAALEGLNKKSLEEIQEFFK